MLTSKFNYNLPQALIAQEPAMPRDSSRLLVVDKKSKQFEHKHFYDLADYLKPGDLLVWNNTKVFKARLRGVIELDQTTDDIPGERPSSNKILNVKPVEIFLVRPMENLGVWKVLARPAKKLRLGMRVRFAPDFSAEIIFKEADGTVLVQFNENDLSVRAKANKYGEVPTPPYIKKYPSLYPSTNRGGARGGVDLEQAYQTIYAKHEGSVAAPTAGFHFTPSLIKKLTNMGVGFAEVTLHVGLGTFLPVKTQQVEEHHMHSEWTEISSKNADLINEAKAAGRRIVAVGTTTVRALEGVAEKGQVRAYSDDLNLFILPGFKFKIVDALITNFHLPESTLLMLVAAFMGDREFALKCYEEAVKEKYRFYSFGDAMLII
ncbi:MAG: tRNA preQ1(34) S-adenosylmethionine ribosyltransferase-isomerase QueA [Patescibacteria group bacterium]